MPEACELIAALDSYLGALYPPERNYLLDVESLCSPEIAFFLARAVTAPRQVAARCGASMRLRLRSNGCLCVRSSADWALAARSLEALEEEARRLGVHALLLETGIEQPEALALYARSGYRRRARYGEYRDEPSSVFMEKLI